MDRKISVGTKVVLSLAGDIIPYIYKVYDYTNFDPAKLGESFPSSDSYIDGCHVMASKIDNEFELLNSALSFKIPGFGTSTVQDFIKWKKKDCEPDEFFGIEAKEMPWNILLCTPTEIENAIGGKTGSNVNKAYTKLLKNIRSYMMSIDQNPSIGSEWFVLGFARSGMELDDSYFQTYYNHFANYLEE